MQKFIPLIARVFIATIFLYTGFGKIPGFSGTQEYMASSGIPAGLTGILLVGAVIRRVGVRSHF
jgi:putative oxidoreductase